MADRQVLDYAAPGVAAVVMQREGEAVRFVIPTVGATGRVVWAALSAALFGAMGLLLLAGALSRGDLCGWTSAAVTLLVAWASVTRAVRAWVERDRPMVVGAGPAGLSIEVPRGGATEEHRFESAVLRQVWVGALRGRVAGAPLWYLHVACVDRHLRIAFAAGEAGEMEAELRRALTLPDTAAPVPAGTDFELIESTVEVSLPERG